MGIRCRAVISASADGGNISSADGRINVRGADSAMIIIAARTSFNGADKSPEIEGRDEKADVARDLDAIKGL